MGANGNLKDSQRDLDKELYLQLRQEIQVETNSSLKIQGWSVALAGTGIFVMIGFLVSKPPEPNAVISNSYLACSAIIAGIGFINMCFIFIGYEQSRGTIRIGAFLYFLEEQIKFTYGWEYFVFNRRKEHQFEDLFAYVPLYVQFGVAAASTLLFLCRCNAMPIVIVVCMHVLFLFSIVLRWKVSRYREQALEAVKAKFFSTKEG